MQRLYVPLTRPTLDRLAELARREMRRNAQEQAAWLIVRGLREAGLDPDREANAVNLESARKP